MKIVDIPEYDRPRERLINYGKESLSNEELLAIILKNGIKNTSAKELSQQILHNYSNITEMNEVTYEELLAIKGIKSAKACDILATIEFGKRICSTYYLKKLKINNTEDIYKYYKNKIGYKKQEYFYCVYLTNKNIIIKDKLLFIGTLNYSMVHPREVFKEAYISSANSIICVHNHPSSNIEPSKEDIELTKRLIEIGTIFGIKIIDHVIIGKDNYYSFMENGRM